MSYSYSFQSESCVEHKLQKTIQEYFSMRPTHLNWVEFKLLKAFLFQCFLYFSEFWKKILSKLTFSNYYFYEMLYLETNLKLMSIKKKIQMYYYFIINHLVNDYDVYFNHSITNTLIMRDVFNLNQSIVNEIYFDIHSKLSLLLLL